MIRITDQPRRGAALALTSAILLLTPAGLDAKAAGPAGGTAHRAIACKGDAGLTVSPGFCATVFADDIGHARHIAIGADGVLYANTWSGRYYANASPPPAGGFVVVMKDTDGDGRADVVQRFGATPRSGGAGGTGVALHHGAVYVEEKDRILRYAFKPGSMVPSGPPEVVLSGLPLTGDHPMHPFVIDASGQLFVDLGSATNACQIDNRIPKSPGRKPCSETATRAGVWRYDADKTNQVFSPAERYASGLRNGEGLAFDDKGRLFATQHGRDQLGQDWPRLYTDMQNAELPAEELVQLTEGGDYGWPQCYYDDRQRRLVLAPEYGGDGGKAQGPCATRRSPVAAFPAHWAPNDLAIYHGDKFPPVYRGGAFIAFHGSWNRAPAPQGGYNVVFQPLVDGHASSPYIVFADGFAGADKSPGKAAFRPSGLAEGPDGALYVADDVHGRIWRITYVGGGADKIAAAPAPAPPARASSMIGPPEGTHPDAGRKALSLLIPPGATREQVALGDRIFHGEASGGTCSGCHGGDAGGSSVGPPPNTGRWLWSDGGLAGLTATIRTGVAHPKRYPGAMPPLGGASLSRSDLAAVSAYVWAVGHAGRS